MDHEKAEGGESTKRAITRHRARSKQRPRPSSADRFVVDDSRSAVESDASLESQTQTNDELNTETIAKDPSEGMLPTEPISPAPRRPLVKTDSSKEDPSNNPRETWEKRRQHGALSTKSDSGSFAKATFASRRNPKGEASKAPKKKDEADLWEKRKESGDLSTVSDTLGNFAKTTEATSRRNETPRVSKDKEVELTAARKEWEKRKDAGDLSTVSDSLGNFAVETAASRVEEKKPTKSEGEVGEARSVWEERKKRGILKTIADELGNFASKTEASRSPGGLRSPSKNYDEALEASKLRGDRFMLPPQFADSAPKSLVFDSHNTLFKTEFEAKGLALTFDVMFRKSDDLMRRKIQEAILAGDTAKFCSLFHEIALANDVKEVLSTIDVISKSRQNETIVTVFAFDCLLELLNEAGDALLLAQLATSSANSLLIWLATISLLVVVITRFVAAIFDTESTKSQSFLPPLRQYKSGVSWRLKLLAVFLMILEPNSADHFYRGITLDEDGSNGAVTVESSNDVVAFITNAAKLSNSEAKSRRLLLKLFFIEDVPEFAIELAIVWLDSSQLGFVYWLSVLTTSFHILRHSMSTYLAEDRKKNSQKLNAQLNPVLKPQDTALDYYSLVGPITQTVSLAHWNYEDHGQIMAATLNYVLARATNIRTIYLPPVRSSRKVPLPDVIEACLRRCIVKFSIEDKGLFGRRDSMGSSSHEVYETWQKLQETRLRWALDETAASKARKSARLSEERAQIKRLELDLKQLRNPQKRSRLSRFSFHSSSSNLLAPPSTSLEQLERGGTTHEQNLMRRLTESQSKVVDFEMKIAALVSERNELNERLYAVLLARSSSVDREFRGTAQIERDWMGRQRSGMQLELTKARDEYAKRMKKQRELGNKATVPDEGLARLTRETAAVKHQKRIVVEESKIENENARQKQEWEERRKAGNLKTLPVEVGNFAAGTLASKQNCKAEMRWEITQRLPRAQREELESAALAAKERETWQKRRARADVASDSFFDVP